MYNLIKSTIIKKVLVGVSVSTMLLTSGLSATASVTYYKSVGSKGETRFTQFPPNNSGNYETIVMRSDGRTDDAGKLAGKTNKDEGSEQLSEAEQQMKVVEDRIKKQKEQDKIRKCQALRNNLTNLNIGGKIYEMRDGKKQYLDEEQIEQKREAIKQAISEYCDGMST